MNFSKLTAFLDSLQTDYNVPGCDCVVFHHHRQVYRRMAGWADAAHTRTVSDTDLYYLFSASKVITCTAFMQLVEQGLVHLEDDLARYLPEFEEMQVLQEMPPAPIMNLPAQAPTRSAARKIRIVDLLTMTSGLSYDVQTAPILAMQKDTGGKATTREMMRAIAATPLVCDPAEHWIYSLSHDVLAAVLEVVTGKTFGAYLQENIFTPLGMKDVHFALRPEEEKRVSELYMHARDSADIAPVPPVNRFRLSENYESGGAGLIMPVEEYAKFLEAMSCGGVSVNGHRILRRDTIDRMRRNYLNEQELQDFHQTGKVGYGYGLGVRTLIDGSTSRSPVGEFGWDGAAGAYVMIDCENEVGVLYVEHVLGHLDSYFRIHPTIRDLTYEALDL